MIDQIKDYFEVSGVYVDLPSKNPDVGLRIEENTVYLVKASEGFCEMIPMSIESLEGIFTIQRIFKL